MFDKINVTCDELEMTKMMCFKYDWNMEIIFSFMLLCILMPMGRS
jgi:hypothetical protein